MPLIPRYMRMNEDDLAWKKADQEAESWQRPGDPVELHLPIRGGNNIIFRLEYKVGSSAALRIPCKGIVKCPEEKTAYDVATMRYIAEKTTIPVAKVDHYGTAAENPLGLGPFIIIMDYIDHETTMSEVFNDPFINSSESHVLDPDVSTEKLELLYRQMANIVLQLSTLTFDCIRITGSSWCFSTTTLSKMRRMREMNISLASFFRRAAAEGRIVSDLDTDEDLPLSQQMRKGWESRARMINYATRNSWTFDHIYWKFLDAELFGHNEDGDHHERLSMLTKTESEKTEQFVRMKIQEQGEPALVEWNDESAATRLAKFTF
ncbi:hypothetical protein F4778DRAFT_788550 [Xylariomycetidae sp. FL2044]|nr:hypothetical protein F4778DRAFT_788550 [Xylariomycetidae sp. FL2044]